MLTRRHIRAKVMQSIYAYRQSGMNDTLVARKNLISGFEKIEELYYRQMSLFLSVRNMASDRIEARKAKLLASHEDLHPNTKFVENPVFAILDECPAIERMGEKYLNVWIDRSEYVEMCLNTLLSNNEYISYMDNADTSFASHKRMAVYLFKKIIAPSEALADYYEDCQMDWVADLQVANSMVLKTIDDLLEGVAPNEVSIPSLFKDEMDRDFATSLLDKVIQTSGQWRDMIEEKAKNWDAERIAMVDFIIMEMAITEFVHFPSIPTKVSLNEYIEISKDYSSAKSKTFVNGILDRILVDMTQNGQIHKSGRGLM